MELEGSLTKSFDEKMKDLQTGMIEMFEGKISELKEDLQEKQIEAIRATCEKLKMLKTAKWAI